MNEIKIAELIHFNNQYYTGGLRDTIYRCSLVGPFALSLCTDKEFIDALYEWFDLVDKHNLDLTESAVELYTDGTIQGSSLTLYDKYTEYFERILDFIMGKVNWTPTPEDETEAVTLSREITAQTLSDLYRRS